MFQAHINFNMVKFKIANAVPSNPSSSSSSAYSKNSNLNKTVKLKSIKRNNSLTILSPNSKKPQHSYQIFFKESSETSRDFIFKKPSKKFKYFTSINKYEMPGSSKQSATKSAVIQTSRENELQITSKDDQNNLLIDYTYYLEEHVNRFSSESGNNDHREMPVDCPEGFIPEVKTKPVYHLYTRSDTNKPIGKNSDGSKRSKASDSGSEHSNTSFSKIFKEKTQLINNNNNNIIIQNKKKFLDITLDSQSSIQFIDDELMNQHKVCINSTVNNTINNNNLSHLKLTHGGVMNKAFDNSDCSSSTNSSRISEEIAKEIENLSNNKNTSKKSLDIDSIKKDFVPVITNGESFLLQVCIFRFTIKLGS
jgi:hypothetical protein